MSTATQTPAATIPANNGKRKRLPEVPKVFNSLAELDAGCKVAEDQGHTYDTRRFEVLSADGKVKKFVLGYSPANAASQVFEDMGIKVTALDAGGRATKAVAATKENALAIFEKLSETDRAALVKMMGIKK